MTRWKSRNLRGHPIFKPPEFCRIPDDTVVSDIHRHCEIDEPEKSASLNWFARSAETLTVSLCMIVVDGMP
jgi:hypothetical protein